jgi:aminodeoxyfutalosine synthase
MQRIHGITFSDTRLIPLWERVRAGERISPAEGLALFESNDFTAIGGMADWVAREKNGDHVHLRHQRAINPPTSVC